MRTAVAVADAHEEGARRALLERLATGLAVISEPYRYDWSCCWLPYTGPYGEHWAWQMCGGQMPGDFARTPDGKIYDCGHWHHQSEIGIAI